jgi:gamma-glutamylcyclotransferase (GGCT)/AIG2-like uncharacterized protein YtfP
MTGTNVYLFVYGTLRKSVPSPMSSLLAREADYIGEGAMQAILYDISRYPGAVLSANPGDWVLGDVYLLRDAAAFFAVLDEYEECMHRYEQPHEYQRALVDIVTPDETRLSAWTYLYNRPTVALKRIVTGDYLRFLTDGLSSLG